MDFRMPIMLMSAICGLESSFAAISCGPFQFINLTELIQCVKIREIFYSSLNNLFYYKKKSIQSYLFNFILRHFLKSFYSLSSSWLLQINDLYEIDK